MSMYYENKMFSYFPAYFKPIDLTTIMKTNRFGVITMSLTIKKCTNDDVQQLIAVGKQTFYETFKDDNTEQNMQDYLATAFTKEKLLAELNHPNSEFYFALVDDHVAGYLKINTEEAQTEKNGDEALEIERIYVKKEYQKHGVGKLLMNRALELAKMTNKQYVWLGVWEKNDNAIAFYEKSGFVKAGKHVFMMGDDEQTDFIMKKTL